MGVSGVKYDHSGDLEAGNAHSNGALYPAMNENPQLRWGFIRKVYVILIMQLTITTVITGLFVFVHPIPHFMFIGWRAAVLMIVLMVILIAVMIAMYKFQSKHPVNLILLVVFTLVMSVTVGIACQFKDAKVVLMAGILTCAVFIGLTLYTFWAAKKGYDFNFLGPFLCADLLMLLTFSLIQLLIPFGRLTHMVFAGVGALVFSAFIIYDTDNLIKRFSYDEYVVAAITLYMDVINLFLNLLSLLEGARQ